jgi:hypothetical protein
MMVFVEELKAELIADVTLYSTDRGGRKRPTAPGRYGCVCKTANDGQQGWECRLLLKGIPMTPGESRRVGMVFLTPDQAVPALRAVKTFYLWEMRIVGEGAAVVE